MSTIVKRRDKLDLCGLTALDAGNAKHLSKSQTLTRISPLLSREEASSARILHHGHSQGDVSHVGQLQRALSAKDRLFTKEHRKGSMPTALFSLTDALEGGGNALITGKSRILTGSMPSLLNGAADAVQSPSTRAPPRCKSNQRRYSKQRKAQTRNSLRLMVDCGDMSLPSFVARCGDLLPLRVRIQRGYRNLSGSVCLSPGDICNAYFAHHMNVVRGTIGGGEVTVPLYTNFRFCMVHDPENNVKRALQGYEYESIGDIIAANPRPKAVRSLSRWKDDHVTIDDDEVLVVVGTLSPAAGNRTVWLEAFSLKYRTLLQLRPDCRGVFTTRPQLLPLPLSDIADYIPDPFPCRTLIYEYQSLEEATGKGDTVNSAVVDLRSRDEETVLVCSAPFSDSALYALPTTTTSGGGGSVIISLPAEFNDAHALTQLRERAQHVRDSFAMGGAGSVAYLGETSSSALCELQSAFYRAIRREEIAFVTSESPYTDSFQLKALAPHCPVTQLSIPVQETKTSADLLPLAVTGADHASGLAQNSFESVEASSASSLSDGSALSTSEPTPPTPPRPWRRCGSGYEDTPPEPRYSSEESLYLSPLSTLPPAGIFGLHSFAKRYGTQFPITADVKDGCVSVGRVQISKGETLTVHGVVYTEAVSVRDDCSKVYILPMDATSEFGVLQDSTFRKIYGEEAEFKAVADIITCDSIPTILCARSQYDGGSQKFSVEPNEVLVVKKVKKLTKVLKVYSVTAETKKSLPAKCTGSFTTAPRAVKLRISKLLKHFPNFLPGRGVAFPDAYCSELPAQLEFSLVTLVAVHPAHTLVCSRLLTQEDVTDEELFSVPLDHALQLQPCEAAHAHAQSPSEHGRVIIHSKSSPQITSPPFTKMQSFEEASESKKNNRKYLSALNENHVLQLLDALHLKKYKKKFKEEKINGHIFCLLDERILKEDLGVDSRLHRIRLMQFVNGDADAKLYLSKT